MLVYKVYLERSDTSLRRDLTIKLTSLSWTIKERKRRSLLIQSIEALIINFNLDT